MKTHRSFSITRMLAILLCLSVFALTGCQSANVPAEPEPSAADQPAGGWTVNAEPVNPSLPEEAKAAFDAAIAELTDADYEPLAYLGSQVVAGINYGFLCRETTSGQPQTKLCTIKVYRDLDGNASVTEVKEFSLSDCVANGEPTLTPEDLAGGWRLNPEDGAPAVLPDEVQAAFDKATDGLAGMGYRPLAYLGSQVVAGRNDAILCSAVSVTAEPQSGLAVLTIYSDLDGNAQITSVSGLDFP